MRNIVGAVPHGKDFFPRSQLIDSIYRDLEKGAHLYLAAPRRMGKTAIMQHLVANPRQNYIFLYIITESVDNPVIYFNRLSEAISIWKPPFEWKDTINRVENLLPEELKQVANLFKQLIYLIYPMWIAPKTPSENVFKEFEILAQQINTRGKKLVLMVDEFPQAVENILRKSGPDMAIQFLQFNHEVRQRINGNICFIFTGSIGLASMAEKLSATKEISDLNMIEVQPLSPKEAKVFILKILTHEGVNCQLEVIEYLLQKIGWLNPYYIQLVIKELLEECAYQKPITKTMVDRVLIKIVTRRNDHHFEHYYSRLKTTFDETEYPFALTVLNKLAQQKEVSKQELLKESWSCNCRRVLRTLEFEGYLFGIPKENDILYRFTSPILKLWWREYVR